MRASEEVPFAAWLEQRARHGGVRFAPIGATEAEPVRVVTRIPVSYTHLTLPTTPYV